MSFYRGMSAENGTLKCDKGTPITAYVARPEGKGPFPGVVLIHHLPGWGSSTSRRHGASPIMATSRPAPTSNSAASSLILMARIFFLLAERSQPSIVAGGRLILAGIPSGRRFSNNRK